MNGRKRVLLTGGILLVAVLAARLISGWIGGPVSEFIKAAFPWVCMGVGVACAVASWNAESK